ncbi:MAG: lipoyl(octanoyl) transferase LipB [Bdellovibrionales bacterium]
MIALKSIEVVDWGLASHSTVQDLQLEAWEKASQDGTEAVLFGELEPVITVGPRSAPEAYYNSNIPHFKVDRGGAVTLHSPGQLVIYPVLHLKKRKLSPKAYVKALLEVTALTYQQLGIDCHEDESSVGIWTSKGKIAFLGVRIREGITQYGLSLNVHNDLKLFEQIHPCGLKKMSLDSLSHHRTGVTPFQVFQIWISCFFRHNAFRKVAAEFDSRDLHW